MRIAVMATGAVGGYFGARMAAAGHDVFFIARGANLAAIRANGLRIESVHGDVHLAKPNATDDPATVGPARAIPGVTYVVTVIERPGVIKQTSQFQSIVCGTPDGRPDAPLQAFVAAAKAAKIDITLSDNIERDRWYKFIFLSATSGATAVTRMPMGPILADPDTRAMFRSIMMETFAVGRAKGVSLDQAFIDQRMANIDSTVPPSMKASMANDLDRGNRMELDWLAGQVSKLGKQYNVPTPVNDTIYAALKLHRMGRQT
jgi:2-dehydropantoate 2-reductase